MVPLERPWVLQLTYGGVGIGRLALRPRTKSENTLDEGKDAAKGDFAPRMVDLIQPENTHFVIVSNPFFQITTRFH